MKLPALIVALAVVTAGAHWLMLRQAPIDAGKSSIMGAAYFPSAEIATVINAAGGSRLWADLYWLAFIQYAGDAAERREDHWQLADEYLNTVTQLDPHFIQPYWFAAFTVGADEKRPDLAAQIIERGIKNNPDNWYLQYIAGCNQYIYANNDRAAARYYTKAASLPGAPAYIGAQAQILASGAPSYLNKARALEAVSSHEADPVVREKAWLEAIAAWKQVMQLSPNQEYRQAAQEALLRLSSPAAAK